MNIPFLKFLKKKEDQRKWYQRRSVIIAIHTIFFLIFIVGFELYTYKENEIETKNLSTILETFLWNLDDSSAKQYLDVYIQNNAVNQIEILHPDNSEFISITKEETQNVLYHLLKGIHLIRIYSLKVPIYHDKEFIGTLDIQWINENIYLYFYVFIILALLTIAAYFYIETIKQKNQLSEAFKEIQELKVQQDADYYLTSLLIQPLVYADVNTEFYKISHYIEQKKKFEYKKFQSEIGGDFIVVKKIALKKRNYLFFINADAMGKSLQGGSGILVLGSILYAIFKRLEFRIEDQSKYPETWLKYIGLEIQELFESFQGSMMLSAVIGLIDEKTGILYYINFEHPYPVIYRYGKADFIGTHYLLRKIGMPRLFQQEIKIQIYELQEEDILIIGSDGKDDLEISSTDQGTRIINEDETLFLRTVEKSEGELSLIIKNVKSTGQLTDDISILQIHCLKKVVPLIQSIPANQSEELKSKMKKLIKQEEFLKIYNILKPYVEEYPLDNTLLYYFTASCMKTKKYSEAIEIGERLLNRTEEIIPIYPILIQSYLKTGNLTRSEYLLEKLKQYDFEEEKIKKLEQAIKSHQSRIQI